MDCGCPIFPTSKRCGLCNDKNIANNSRNPGKEILDNLLKENKNNVCAVARIFKVSYTAVNKWINTNNKNEN